MRQTQPRYSTKFRIRSGALIVLTFMLTMGTAVAQDVGGPDLKKLFSGLDVILQMSGRDAKDWVSGLWRFRADGSLTGYLFSSAYTSGRKPKKGLDNGGWWVSGDKICVQWSVWDGGEKYCYAISGIDTEYTATGDKGLLLGRFTIIK